MSPTNLAGEYVFTIDAKRRPRSNPRYNGILRTHRFYIRYHSLLKGQSPKNVLENGEPLITFPVSFMENILNFGLEVGGKLIHGMRIRPSELKFSYSKPLILLPNEIAFRRHLLFSLTVSTLRKPTKINTLRKFMLTINANFLNTMSQIALDRYKDSRDSERRSWYWHILRVGRTIKVLYRLDR